MIANGNIDARQKRNIRIGLGVLAVALVAFGGYKVAQWVGGNERGNSDGQSSTQGGSDALSEAGGVEPGPSAPREERFEFDLSGSRGNEHYEDFSRARGEVSISVAQPYKVDGPCSIKAPSGTSIVPVTIKVTNMNDPAWVESEKFEPDVASVIIKDPPKSWTIRLRNENNACAGYVAFSAGPSSGEYREVTYLVVGVPEGKETKIPFAVVGPDDATSPFGYEPTTVDGEFWKPKMKSIPVTVKG